MSEKLNNLSIDQELHNTPEALTAAGFKELIKEYGINGDSPVERLESLRNITPENLAYMMMDLNKSLQGSDSTLVSEKTMKVGENKCVAPEYRYDLFVHLLNKIKSTPEDINPMRVGDALALGTVLLHPFQDGNGRTSRTLGLIFDSDFDGDSYEASFKSVTESRDIARKRGGAIVLGYIPRMGEGVDQSDPANLEAYFDRILTSENTDLYVGTFGNPPLKIPQPSLVG